MAPPWPSSAWTSAKRSSTRARISSSPSLLAMTSPSPWIPEEEKHLWWERSGQALPPSRGMPKGDKLFWPWRTLKCLFLMWFKQIWRPISRWLRRALTSVINVMLPLRPAMAWRSTLESHTRKVWVLLKSCVRKPPRRRSRGTRIAQDRWPVPLFSAEERKTVKIVRVSFPLDTSVEITLIPRTATAPMRTAVTVLVAVVDRPRVIKESFVNVGQLYAVIVPLLSILLIMYHATFSWKEDGIVTYRPVWPAVSAPLLFHIMFFVPSPMSL